MLKQLTLTVGAVFSIILTVNAQEVTDNLEKAVNDPQAVGKGTEQAEIKQIDTIEKETKKEAADQLKGTEAKAIEKEEAKDRAEDKAVADTETAIEEENADSDDSSDIVTIKGVDTDETDEAAEEEHKSSSWFGWLWPFGGDDNDEAAENDTDTKASEVAAEPATATENTTVATEETEQPVETVETETVETETAEKENKSSSWFGWLWPFGSDDDDKTAAVETTDDDSNKTTEAVADSGKTEDVTEAPEPATADASQPEPIAENTADEEEPVVAQPVEETSQETQNKVAFSKKLLYYFPNLGLNLLDSFSVNLGVGAESGIKLGLTHYFELGGSYGDAYFVEKGILRRYGGGYRNGYSFQLGPLSSEKRYVDDVYGDTPDYIIKEGEFVAQHPEMTVYNKQPLQPQLKDFWACSIEAGWLLNIGLKLHPVQLADFFTGIFFYDLCGDDWYGNKNDKPADENVAESVETEQVSTEEVEETPADETESADDAGSVDLDLE